MSKVRVIRILEYTYDSVERMLDDQARWYIGINGKRTHRWQTIKSATLPPELFDDLAEMHKGVPDPIFRIDPEPS